jgi:hypothetical protein
MAEQQWQIVDENGDTYVSAGSISAVAGPDGRARRRQAERDARHMSESVEQPNAYRAVKVA